MQQVQKYLQIIIQGWWIIALTTLSAFNLALYSSYTATPLYRTTARFIVIPDPVLLATTKEQDTLRFMEALDKRSIVATYAEVMSSPRFYDEAVNTVLQLDPNKLGYYTVSTVVLPDTSAIELSVEGPNPEIAAILANTVGETAIAYIKGIQIVYDISLLEPAEPPHIPFSPTPARDAGVAVVLGLVFGVLLAVLRDQFGYLLSTLGIFGLHPQTDIMPPSIHTDDAFQKRLKQELAHSPQGSLSLGLIRLDGLQTFAGKSPHAAVRQQILNRVIKILCEELPKNVILGRRDSTSFAVLLPAMSGSVAVHVIGHVQQALTQPIELDQPDIETTLLSPHAGVTEYDGQSASILINQAEMALEWSYQNGKQAVLYASYKQL